MAISLSLYDFFAHLVPGGVCLIALLYGFQEAWLRSPVLTTLTTAHLIGLGLVAYILGYAIDPLANRWYRFFQGNIRQFQLSQHIADELASFYPNVTIDSKAIGWTVLLAYVRRRSLPMAQEIERLNVSHIMLRGISFGLLVFAFIFCYKIFVSSVAWLPAVCSLICMATSYLLMQEAIKFRKWFYQAVYQSILALQLKPEQLPVQYQKT